MAIIVRGSDYEANASSPLTVELAGILEDDLLLLQVYTSSGETPTVPSGFSLVSGLGDTDAQWLYTKTATGAEPANYEVSVASGTLAIGLIVIYSDVGSPIALDNFVANSDTGTSVTFPSIVINNTYAIMFYMSASAVDRTFSGTPSSSTKVYPGAVAARIAAWVENRAQAGNVSAVAVGSSPSSLNQRLRVTFYEDGPANVKVIQSNILVENEEVGVRVTQAGNFIEMEGSGIFSTQYPVLVEIGASGVYVTQYMTLVEIEYQEPSIVPTYFVKNAGNRANHMRLPDEQTGYALDPKRSFWSIVVPEDTENLVRNPSFETGSVGYASSFFTSTAVVSESPYATRGIWMLRIIPNPGVSGNLRYSLTLTPGPYTFAADVYTYAGIECQLQWYDVSAGAVVGLTEINPRTNGWVREQVTFVCIGSGTYEARLVVVNPDSRPLYTDGWQVENKRYATTYTDGDILEIKDRGGLKSFFWTGEPHASTSKRKKTSNFGGRIVNWSDIVDFRTTSIIGLGMSEQEHFRESRTSRGEEFYVGSRDLQRNFTVTGKLFAQNYGELQSSRKELIKLIRPDNNRNRSEFSLIYRPTDEKGLPTGVPLAIDCVYNEGLGGSITNFYQETVGMQFTASSPFMRELIDINRSLQVSQLVSANEVSIRESHGGWRIPKADGFVFTKNTIRTVAFDFEDQPIIGGSFTGYAKREVGNSWVTMGSLNGTVNMVRRWRGQVIAVGNFTAPNHIALYDEGTSDWVGFRSGVNGEVLGMVVGRNNSVYIWGQFLSADSSYPQVVYRMGRLVVTGGVEEVFAAGDYATNPALLNFTVPNAAAYGPDDRMYWSVGGQLYSAEAVNPDSAWVYHDMNLFAYTITSMGWGEDGNLYFTGQVVKTSLASNRYGLFRWNGFFVEEVAVDDNTVNRYSLVKFDQEGVGWFWSKSIDVGTHPDSKDFFGVYRFTNNSFVPAAIVTNLYPDLVPSSISDPLATQDAFFDNDGKVIMIKRGATDPALSYDGGAGWVSVNNGGSAHVKPQIYINGEMRPKVIRNNTTGGELWFKPNSFIAEGKRIIIDFSSGRPVAYDNLGNDFTSIIDFSISTIQEFYLLPGENDINFLGYPRDTEESSANLVWKNRHWGMDFSIDES